MLHGSSLSSICFYFFWPSSVERHILYDRKDGGVVAFEALQGTFREARSPEFIARDPKNKSS